jgi:hypothetical protein
MLRLLRLNRPEQAEATLWRARGLLEPFETQLRSDIDGLLAERGAART